MAGILEKPQVAEQKPEETQEAAPEIAAEEEMSPEALEANVYFEQLRDRLNYLSEKLHAGWTLEPKELEELDILQEQVEAFDDLGEIEEIIEE